ncbi:hypothetical protein DIM_15380 [Candidatus Denitrolinea symbiosum]|nr:hypothetical protein DIM_15380 [Candidatus Denitrolinea symbiosum]
MYNQYFTKAYVAVSPGAARHIVPEAKRSGRAGVPLDLRATRRAQVTHDFRDLLTIKNLGDKISEVLRVLITDY